MRWENRFLGRNCWKSIMSDRIGLFAGPEVKMAGDEEMFPPTAMGLEPRGFPGGPGAPVSR